MIVFEQNKINSEPCLRVTSDKENHYVKVKNSENEPTNEIIIQGENTDLEFDEVYVEQEVQMEENEINELEKEL